MFNRIFWPFLIRSVARAHGFIDPIRLLSHIGRFGQPSEVMFSTELLRATIVLYARGLLNAYAIQQNLDWIWPFWVNQQFDPASSSFVPRAFSITHLNLTHRNWTAVGLPDFPVTPLVDPRGMVTPFWDSWSLDSWIIGKDKTSNLIPSRLLAVEQVLDIKDSVRVITTSSNEEMEMISEADMIREGGVPVCRFKVKGRSKIDSSLVISVRPCNSEGISLIRDMSILRSLPGWRVNKHHEVQLSNAPEKYAFSNYHHGDVFLHLDDIKHVDHMTCPVEMVTAAAVFPLEAGREREVTALVPLDIKPARTSHFSTGPSWKEQDHHNTLVTLPDKKFEFLFNAAIKTLLLHTIEDVYAGPYTYRRFWFRDAVFITYTLSCCGFVERAEKIIDRFHKRQKASGYFESQEGEWDSNGQVLWLIHQFSLLNGTRTKHEWVDMVRKAGNWIKRVRMPANNGKIYAGLMPSGFSAEHLGPNDFYYWDDFWSVSGLRSASAIMRRANDPETADIFNAEGESLFRSIDASLQKTSERLKTPAMPSSPFRRLDSASVASLVAGYPLQLWDPQDPRLIETAKFLIKNCLVHGGLYHNMNHSGINPYLTLSIAQVFMRAGNPVFYALLKSVADLASPTGQWPEAIHPLTKGGCMGDGQHVWAAAEWILIIRNAFVREEGRDRLVLCAGIHEEWLKSRKSMAFGPAWTEFGKISIEITFIEDKCRVSWEAMWNRDKPGIEVRFPGRDVIMEVNNQNFVEVMV